MQHDLSGLSLRALQNLEQSVAKAIHDYEGRRKEKAVRALMDTAAKHGFTLVDIFGAVAVSRLQGTRTRQPARPKFRNPEHPDQTWSGRGMKPRWVVRQLNAGKSLDDLSI
jgi:DNA-binding protein H-NS